MKVSVCMITFNHEKYISRAISSILLQKFNYDFEIIIGEDNSHDSTLEICKKFASCYSEKIRLLPSAVNIGAIPNFARTLRECNGEYIALCEGDDYWCDPYKLQKQINFLEFNHDFSICFHNVKILKDNSILEDTLTKNVPSITNIFDLAKENYIHTPSVVFRNHLNGSLPEDFISAPVGDYFIHMLNARYGKIMKLNDLMAVYRIHNKSLHSSKPQYLRDQEWLTQLWYMIPCFDEEVRKVLIDQYIAIAKGVITEGNISKHRKKEIYTQLHELHIENLDLNLKYSSVTKHIQRFITRFLK